MIHESNVFNSLDLAVSRSTFSHKPTTSGTCNAGRLIPGRTFWVQPGDSISMDVNALFKMSTPVYPTMDALFCDVFFFFVPFRLILSRRYGTPNLNEGNQSWAAIVGAQDNLQNMPIPASGLHIPKLGVAATGYKPGVLLDYFPVNYKAQMADRLSALPLMAYFAIWNENFRDPNVMYPITWSFDSDNVMVPYGNAPLYATKEELTTAGRNPGSNDYQLVNALGSDSNASGSAQGSAADKWLPFPVCRFHGYFGSALPWPQRDTDGVALPLYGGNAKLVAGDDYNILDEEGNASNLRFGSNMPSGQTATKSLLFFENDDNLSTGEVYGEFGWTPGGSGTLPNFPVNKTNLYADLSQTTAANVNALRAAFAKQRWYEKLARSGNRYDELEYGLFGVRPHDSGDDRPVYLGGKRIPLKIEMVASTNGGSSASGAQGAGSLGSLGAFSHTNDADHYFYHSFDDWGVVMCLFCIRHHDTFGSGTDRFWLKDNRDDLYFPEFAHLGEQATDGCELMDQAPESSVFGYMPAWSEYRNELDRVHGLLRPGKSLDYMTYARDFAAGNNLASFLNASSQVQTVDKTLAVTSNASGFQFVYQMTFDMKIRRAMPTESIPGLIDHA